MRIAIGAMTATVIILVFAGAVTAIIIMAAYPVRYRDEINAAATRFEIEPQLIAAVIRAESRFKHDAVSNKDAIGLMQLLPSTAAFIAQKNSIEIPTNIQVSAALKDPELNIMLGVAYLRYLLDKFDDLQTALFAYNAGEGNVSRWLREQGADSLTTTPFAETNAYAARVLGAMRVYRWRL